jgi:hypothetical protein
MIQMNFPAKRMLEIAQISNNQRCFATGGEKEKTKMVVHH